MRLHPASLAVGALALLFALPQDQEPLEDRVKDLEKRVSKIERFMRSPRNQEVVKRNASLAAVEGPSDFTLNDSQDWVAELKKNPLASKKKYDGKTVTVRVTAYRLGIGSNAIAPQELWDALDGLPNMELDSYRVYAWFAPEVADEAAEIDPDRVVKIQGRVMHVSGSSFVLLGCRLVK